MGSSGKVLLLVFTENMEGKGGDRIYGFGKNFLQQVNQLTEKVSFIIFPLVSFKCQFLSRQYCADIPDIQNKVKMFFTGQYVHERLVNHFSLIPVGKIRLHRGKSINLLSKTLQTCNYCQNPCQLDDWQPGFTELTNQLCMKH